MKPWAHQLEALRRSKDKAAFAYFFDPGTGKTLTAINRLRIAFNTEKKILPTLVITPPITLENWKREWLMHSNIPPEKIIVVTGQKSQRVLRLLQLEKDPNCIVLINYEAILSPDIFRSLLMWSPKCLILDESHKVKNPSSKRAKRVETLSVLAEYKFLLSGSPILNSLMDLFSQFRIMAPEVFGRNFFAFRNRFFFDKNRNMHRSKYYPDWCLKEKSYSEIQNIIDPHVMRVKKEDCLDLPPLIRKKIFVPLSPDQQAAYNEMKKDFITFIKDRACLAELAITKALRLQQIVSGFVTVELGGGEREAADFKENPRAAALQELLEEITPSNKVIIWAVFRRNYAQIKEVLAKLKLDYVEVHGDVSSMDKQAAVDKFSTDPTCKVFLGHPGSGGIGINLVSASYSIFYSRNFSLENDLQAEARNYRGGSQIHDKITRIDLVSPGTIDEEVLKALEAKVKIGENVLKEWAESI